MKKFRTIACVLLILLMLMMAGCGAQDEWEAAQKAAGLLSGITEDPQLRADTEKLLDAIISDEYAAAWDALYEEIDAAEFRRMYVELQPHLAEMENYELVPSYINKSVNNGVSSTFVRYMMTAGKQRFFVEVARVEGYDGLFSFYINEYQPVITTGTLGNMQGADVLQWIFLIVGMLEIVFALCVFVDCCRHKMRKKWLWLVIIGLGYVVFQLMTTPEQFRVGMRWGAILSYTSLLRYSTGGFTLCIMIPAGALVYLVLRKRLFANFARFQQQKVLQVQEADAASESEEVSVAEPEECAQREELE